MFLSWQCFREDDILIKGVNLTTSLCLEENKTGAWLLISLILGNRSPYRGQSMDQIPMLYFRIAHRGN